jgi:chromosome segregation ATPase
MKHAALVSFFFLRTLVTGRESSGVNANPVRKVVTLLQSMQTKIEEEGDRDLALFNKYMCYCKTSGGSLQSTIADATAKVPEVGSAISEAEEKNVQLKADIEKAKKDRASAKEAMAEATSIREKTAAAFAAENTETTSNLDALTKAIAAIEGGMAGSFLQTPAAQLLRTLMSSDLVFEGDKTDVLSFLSGKTAEEAGYAPQSGEITGILKQLKDTMAKGLAEATSAEEADIKAYDALMTAKKKEVAAQTVAIEQKTVRSGELAVEIVQMKNDLSQTQKSLEEDKEFLANLKANCATKDQEWNEISKTRSDELIALAETIKILNDDDALELFKKTLPSSAGTSLMQVSVKDASFRQEALNLIRNAPTLGGKAQMHLLLTALRGKAAGFEKVVAMIDDMVALLKKEQVDDEEKKEYCEAQFDSLDDKKKALERSSSDLETQIDEAKDRIATLANEIESFQSSIVALDKSVSEATEQRKEEHAAFTELISTNTAAKKLLGIAKNRLNQFYNPKLYVAPAKRELSADDQIVVNMGGTAPPTPAPGGIAGTGVTVLADVSAHEQLGFRAQPPPPPEAVGAYSKKSEESTGVIAMIDLLVKDLDKEITEGEVSEKDAQADYEVMMADSKQQRAESAKSIAEKASAKAQIGEDLEVSTSEKTATKKELAATVEVIASLHSECDWLMQNFDVRKEARTGEVDSLVKAKAVLSGADFSMLQINARNRLRGRH